MFILSGIGNNIDEIPIGLINNIKDADLVFLEYYTNFVDNSILKYLLNINSNIKLIDRDFVEYKLENIILNNKDKKIILIVSGNPLFATTHFYFIELCKKNNINFKIINSASVFDEVGKTGLFLYKFGRIISVPFHESTDFYDNIINNYRNNLHTLLLLDLDPKNNIYLDHKEAIRKIMNLDKNRVFNEDFKLIVCSKLNRDGEKIYYDSIRNLMNMNIEPPLCIIIPSNLNKIEEDFLSCMIS
ncbi:diphthine synthase [Nanobdella aerobiophila]|uniref:Diphthine synthase n=1 Tax=Nanobdella aerobiophila TaxID=2586965 RepID=A0A915WSK4_9ARCH|nr:diphthine synthase [Nanobdella aerobiophila]BBL45400.1 diphthine synthase [Nanobdella aerobiophila]